MSTVRFVVQTTLDTLLDRAGLRDYLRSLRDNYTLFAPQNTAWDAAFYTESLDCTADYYVTAACDSQDDLQSATNLKEILLNHGMYELACMHDGHSHLLMHAEH